MDIRKKHPQSPDINILEFGYFKSIQFLNKTNVCKTVDVLF